MGGESDEGKRKKLKLIGDAIEILFFVFIYLSEDFVFELKGVFDSSNVIEG